MPSDKRRADRLDVYHDSSLIGTLFDTDPISFEYSERWIAAPGAQMLPGIELAAGRVSGEKVSAVFDNLLPEGALRDYISLQRQASTLFSLLREVAGDTAGGLLILKHGEKPKAPRYRKTTWNDLAGYLSGKLGEHATDINAKGARISLSGAQDKVLIAIDAAGKPMLPLGESPSTHILKPDIKRLPRIRYSAANEAIVMLAAAKAGLPVAEVFYEPITGACIVKRFDRELENGRLIRLFQYDLCQLQGTLSERKYETEGGPGVRQCAQLIRQYSVQPASDLLRLLEWLFFNLYVGNNDSHAKNLSVYSHPKQGTVLAPFYDLMCTRAYPGLSGKFAFAIGGERRPGSIGREHVARMATELGFRAAYLLDIAEQLASRIPSALDESLSTVQPLLPASGKILAQRLQWKILEITKRLSKRILGARHFP